MVQLPLAKHNSFSPILLKPNANHLNQSTTWTLEAAFTHISGRRLRQAFRGKLQGFQGSRLEWRRPQEFGIDQLLVWAR